jgi:hypothetical protein
VILSTIRNNAHAHLQSKNPLWQQLAEAYTDSNSVESSPKRLATTAGRGISNKPPGHQDCLTDLLLNFDACFHNRQIATQCIGRNTTLPRLDTLARITKPALLF